MCDNMILCIRYDIEHSLRCIIPIGGTIQKSHSRTFFLGSVPSKYNPIPLNGAIYVHSGILKFVVASEAESELGDLFLNMKEVKILQTILEELGHTQPPTPIHCDNFTSVGIANDTVKNQRSRSMEMRFFWITDQVRHV